MKDRRAAFMLSVLLVFSSLGFNTASSGNLDTATVPSMFEGVTFIDNDWNVADHALFLNSTIYLSGNLTVEKTGHLELVNSTLAMDLVGNGQYRISIEGTFTMADLDNNPATSQDASVIKSNNSAHRYTITSLAGSQLLFSNGIITNCGYDSLNPGLTVSGFATIDGMLFQTNHYGITIKSNDVTVLNSNFTGSYYGVYSYFCNPVLKDLAITGSSLRGMYLYYSKPVLENCVFLNNKIGIYFQNSEPDMRSCMISGSTTAGVYTWYSSPLLIDCSLNNTLDMDVQMRSFPRLLNTTLDASKVRLALGLYASVGHRMDVSVVNSTGAAIPGVRVAVLDTEGNPASSGITNETGIATNLAFRERLLTREGPIDMPTHSVLAFSLLGKNITYGEKTTFLVADSTCVVEAERNPPGIQMLPAGAYIANTTQFVDTRIIALGDININGGSLELQNSELLMHSSNTRTLTVSTGSLVLESSSLSTLGTTRLLEPSRVLVTADTSSPIYVSESRFRWITELVVRNGLSEFGNATVEHASLYGLKVLSCSPVIDGLVVDWSPVGLYLSGGNSKVSNIIINRARDYAIYAIQSAATLADIHANNSSRGVYSYNSILDLSGFLSTYCGIGIYALYSVMQIDSANVTGSESTGLYFIDSSVTADDSAISHSATAINVQTSDFFGESISILSNSIGLKASESDPVLLNSSFSNVLDVSVERGSSASLVNCTPEVPSTSVQPSGHIDIGDWFSVSVLGENDLPVAGCNVSAMDSAGRVSGSGMTDDAGMLPNLAFRHTRVLWNSTEEYFEHTVIAFRDFNGSLHGSVSTPLHAGGSAEVRVAPDGLGLVEWVSPNTILEPARYYNATILAHRGVTVDNGAEFEIENSTLWFFGPATSNTYLDVKSGSFNVRNSTLMPLSARAPLQPSTVWITYRAGSSGELENSRFDGIHQVSTYTSNLAVRNSMFANMAGTGIYIQACSPTIDGSTFIRCQDGIWSSSGSPVMTNTSMIECTDNGVYFGGGSPVLVGVRTSHDINGFYLAGDTKATLVDCIAELNKHGFYMENSSPDIRNSTALNNANSGFYCQESHPNLRSVESIGNANGLYCYKSWPIIYNSRFTQNANGISASQSAPYLQDCDLNGNGVGLSSTGDATGITTTVFSSGKAQEHSTFVNSEAREHISISLPSRSIVSQANITIIGSEIGGDAVIEDKYTQYYPVIHGDWMVWQGLRDEDWDIYAYNLSMDSDGNGVPNYLETPALADDPALVRITNNPYMQAEADIFEDTVVWTDYRNGIPDIYAYTFSNSTEWVVCDNPSAQIKPSIDGDKIIWQDYRNGNYDIFMLNITNGKVSMLSKSDRHDMGARIHGDYVVWYNYYGSPPSSDYSDIMLFDTKTWTLTNINNDAPVQYSPDVHGETVVWHDNRNGNWEIYQYNIRTTKMVRVTYDIYDQHSFMPRIYGDKVVYYTHNRVTGIWGVRMSNLTTGVPTVLERDVKGDSHPVIYDQRIAWVNRTGNLNDIYVLDMSLSGYPSNVSVDLYMDGSAEFHFPDELAGKEYINGTWLADILNRNLDRIDPGMTAIPISVSADGIGRVVLGPMSIKYDIPTYLVNSTLGNSSVAGARCTGSSPIFVNSSFQSNALDLYMASSARPSMLNSTFSESKLYFQDTLSNLTVRNYLHVRVENLTSDPLDARILVTDNGHVAHDTFAGEGGQAMWMRVTDRTHNFTGRHENLTVVAVAMGTTLFPNNPRDVNMSVSHWEIFSTDSVGPEIRDPFPPPGWTTSLKKPEISVIITDSLGLDLSTVRLYVQGFAVYYEHSIVPNGYNISYTHPLDFPDGTLVMCRIYGRDVHGNAAEFVWEFKIDIRAEAFSIPLQAGWNLISLPFDTYNASIESVLWSISGKYDIARAYSSGGVWLRYRPASSSEFNDLSTMSRGVGYWIYATEPCVLNISGVPVQSTSITLYAGWNLVGYSSMTEETVANSLWGTSADRVEVHDALSPYLISTVDSTYPMKPGQGYWVRVPADVIWVVDW